MMTNYSRVLKVIESCTTSRQNMVAYRMIWNFRNTETMRAIREKRQPSPSLDLLCIELFAACDENLIEVCK